MIRPCSGCLRHTVGKTRITYQLLREWTGLPRTVESNTQHELYKGVARYLIRATKSRNQIPLNSANQEELDTRHFHENANRNHTHARQHPAQALPLEKYVCAAKQNGTKHFTPPRAGPSRR